MTATNGNQRVVIIGWDGATWDLIDPWIAEGKLPNLARFRSESCSGPLRSTVPHFTYPAWTTFLTGKNPGRHGVLDFTERIPGTHQIQFVNAGRVRSKTVWRLLSDTGRRVGCMGVPVSYPPEPVNGVLICGFDAPGSGARTDSGSVYPPELLSEIRSNVGDYVTAANIMPLISQDRYEEALDLILSVMEMKGKTARYLLEKEAWDVFMVLFGESDLVGHHYWRFTDPSSPLYASSRSAKVREGIYQVYAKLDEMLPMLLEACPPDSVRFIVSDHGFGGSSDRVIFMNKWLADEGLLSFAGGDPGGGLAYKMTLKAKYWGLRFLPPAVKTYIFRRRQSVAGRMESYLRFGGIDWSKTKAFSEELPYMQTIWINLKGREPHGVVEPGAEYDEIVARLRERLLAWIDPISGENVVEQVLHRDELYDGPYKDRSPDILVRTRYPGGYAYQGRSSRQALPNGAIEKIDLSDPGVAKFYAGKSGSHRDYGIFLAQGPMIVPGKIEGAGLIDVAPTILYLLGEPVPADMDGKVLTDAIVPGYVESRPLTTSSIGSQTAGSENATYSEEDEAVINQRLKDMGYLE